MAAPYTPTTVTSGYGAEVTINANFQAIATALETVLNKDSSTDNAMVVDLDLNGNDLLNVNSVSFDDSAKYGALSVSITDTGGYYTGDTVEAALQEVGASILATKLIGSPATSNYTLSSISHQQFKQITGSSSVTITVPLESTDDLSLSDDEVFIHSFAFNGSGDFSISGETGAVVLIAPEGRSLVGSTTGIVVSIMKSTEQANTWYVIGNTDAA